jgi:hypothetical protein
MTASIHTSITVLNRPHIEPSRDGAGWIVLRGSHAWHCGDRRAALAEFGELVDIERRGRS